MPRLYHGVALTGTVIAGLSLGNCGYDAANNVEGDGTQPGNSLTSRVLGVERYYYCERVTRYSRDQGPWDCDFFAHVETERHERIETLENGLPVAVVDYEPERLKHKVAKAVGPNLEFWSAAVLAGFGAYKASRKRRGR